MVLIETNLNLGVEGQLVHPVFCATEDKIKPGGEGVKSGGGGIGGKCGISGVFEDTGTILHFKDEPGVDEKRV